MDKLSEKIVEAYVVGEESVEDICDRLPVNELLVRRILQKALGHRVRMETKVRLGVCLPVEKQVLTA